MKPYTYYLKSKVCEAEHTLSDKEDYIIAAMRNCSSNAWSNLNYEQLSSLTVEVKLNANIENVPFSTSEAMLSNASKYEKIQLMEFDLDCKIGDILLMYSRYIFEKELFELKQEKTLSATELNELMSSAQRQAFGDTLDKEF